MDTVSAIIGLAIMALLALPFILMAQSRRKNEKRFSASLQSLAQKHHTTISEQDFCSQFAIGVGKDGQHAFFITVSGGKEADLYVALHQMQRCQANTVTRTVGEGRNKETVIDRLELVFQPKEPKERAQTWVLYAASDNIQLSDELELMRKWEKQLNALLKESKVGKAVA